MLVGIIAAIISLFTTLSLSMLPLPLALIEILYMILFLGVFLIACLRFCV